MIWPSIPSQTPNFDVVSWVTRSELSDWLIGRQAAETESTASAVENMASTSHSQSDDESQDHQPVNGVKQEDAIMSDSVKHPHSDARTPEPRLDQGSVNANTPSTPGLLAPFDWSDFEARFEKALNEADEAELQILREAETLSKVQCHDQVCSTWAKHSCTVLQNLGICCLLTR
jgi:hypothetical protein